MARLALISQLQIKIIPHDRPGGCPPSAARCTLLLFMLVLNLRLGADKLIIFLARNTLALPPGYVDAGCPVAG